MYSDLLGQIASSLCDLHETSRIKELVNDALSQGVPVTKIIEEGIRRGLDCVGRKYENSEYFLSELLYATSLVNDAFELLKPRLMSEDVKKKGAIVLGTVKGDLHDIGKNIFKVLAEAADFAVYDLGVDVEPEAFIRKLKETGAPILGLSALLTTTTGEMKSVVDMLIQEGVRGKTKVILGGNAVTKEFAREIGADAAALDAVEGLKICEERV